MTRLVLEHVSFWYPATAIPALADCSLDVAGGEVVALVGHIGAGASTLLLVAGDLAPRVVGGRLQGVVRFEGRGPAGGAGSAGGGGGRGIVLPTPWTQLSGMAFTVWEEVAFGPANLGWARSEIAQQVDRALARLDISALADREPGTLSGGELQRVVLAAIVAMQPALLLLDEPTAELDAVGARLLWRLVRTLAAEDTAVVVATSDLDAIGDFADRVAWLDGGRLVKSGPPALLADEALCAVGLGTTVAGVWRAAQLPAPYPVNVADAVRRCR